MERQAILCNIEKIVREVLKDDSLVLAEGNSSNDFDGWDSLADVQITEKIKDFYGCKIPLMEIVSWDSVGDIIDSIIKRV